MIPEQLREIFRADVPEGFLSDWVALLERAYPQAHTRVYTFHSAPEAHDLLGDTRRAMIEEGSREIAGAYPGMRASVRQNKRGTHSYTEIRAGRVVLTSSCLPYRHMQLRQADFRRQYVRTLQHTIREIRPDTVLEEGPIFAVLVHGPQEREETELIGSGEQPRLDWLGERPKLDWSRLGYAFAGFPTLNFRAWETKIELLVTYGRQPMADGVSEEKIEATFELKIRQDIAEGKSGAGA